ncbi:MAG: hypothetical protein GF370_03180 [Candidatus Nealsonbacteria bacterium]|nr:hypothetical protein [Candidatus Nealsonbacteria bacterium]
MSFKKTLLTIGGGDGSYFQKEALKNPHNFYVVTDPSLNGTKNQITIKEWCLPTEKLPNLSFIESGVFKGNRLPLREKSVDVIEINFLMGEIFWLENEVINTYQKSINKEEEKYLEVLKEAKRLLKDTGKLFVSDVRYNILRILKLVRRAGFCLDKEPKSMTKKRTFFAEFFSSITSKAKELGKGTGDCSPYFLCANYSHP